MMRVFLWSARNTALKVMKRNVEQVGDEHSTKEAECGVKVSESWGLGMRAS